MKANAPLWIVSLGQGGGDAAAVGGPGAPNITNPEGGSVIYFTAGDEGAAGPTLAYGAYIEPEGPTVTVESDDPSVGGEVALANTEPFTDYVVTIYGVNIAGRGKTASTNPFQLNYNEATGGTETIKENYNGTGETWKVHTFTDSGTLKVSADTNPFRVLVVAGGGGGSEGGGGGGAGGMLEDEALDLAMGDIPVTVGNGGALKANGQDSSLGSFLSCKGGGRGGSWLGQAGGSGGSGGSGGGGNNGSNGGAGGSGIAGQGHSGSKGNNYVGPAGGGANGTSGGPNNGRASTITGSSVKYAGGGGAGPWEGYGGPQGQGYGGGGGGGGYANGGPQKGSAGKKGVVIVAYQIGSSTTREIAQAEAEAAAREAGYATGYDVGVGDGFTQRDSEITAAFVQAAEDKPKRTRKKAD